MGFGRKSRKRAKEAQWLVFQNALNSMNQYDQLGEEVRNRMKEDLTQLRGVISSSADRLSRFDAGKDVGDIYRGVVSGYHQTADAIKRTMDFTSALGNNSLASFDQNYIRKLQTISQKELARGLSESIMREIAGERARDLDVVLKGSGILADLETNLLNTKANAIRDWLGLGSFISNIREQEMMRGKLFWSNLGDIFSLGTGILQSLAILKSLRGRKGT